MQAGKSVSSLEARDRVGGRVLQPRARRRRGLRARRDLRRADPEPHPRAAKDYGVDTFDTYDDAATTSTIDERPADRPTATPARPGRRRPTRRSRPTSRTVVTQLDQMSTTVPVDAPWEAPKRRDLGRPDARDLDQGQQVNPRLRAICRPRPRARSSAPSRASCRCCSCSSTSPRRATRPTPARSSATSTRATARRCGASSAARSASRCDGRGRPRAPRLPQPAGAPDRADAKRRARRRPTRATSTRKRVIVAVPPTLAGRIDYEPILPFAARPAHPAPPQGALIKVAAVYDKPFWRDEGLNGTGLDADGPGQRDVRRLAAGRQARASSSASSAATRRASFARAAGRAPRSRCSRSFAKFFGDEALKPDATTSRPTGPSEQWTRGCPVGDLPARACCSPTATRSASRSAASTGPAPRPRPTGTATWTAPCARASAPRSEVLDEL